MNYTTYIVRNIYAIFSFIHVILRQILFTKFSLDIIMSYSLESLVIEDGRRMELAQDRAQCRALALAVLNLRVFYQSVVHDD
jgi:hypothetical protein